VVWTPQGGIVGKKVKKVVSAVLTYWLYIRRGGGKGGQQNLGKEKMNLCQKELNMYIKKKENLILLGLAINPNQIKP